MSIDSTTPDPPSPTPTQSSPPLSRKQKRLSKHLQYGDNIITTVSIPLPTTSPQPPVPIPRPLKAPAMPPSRLLIASIGNPAPYLSTLHSAGHTVLFALASTLQLPLQKSGREWAHGLLSQGEEWTLWASPVQMNISGTAVANAWKTFVSQSRGEAEPRLVVLHDELEAPLGSIKVRPGSASAKGHNGLKSIREKIPGVEYVRIGIGIGRPESREPGVVAGYVLRKMTGSERGKIEGCVGGVVGELRRLSGE